MLIHTRASWVLAEPETINQMELQNHFDYKILIILQCHSGTILLKCNKHSMERGTYIIYQVKVCDGLGNITKMASKKQPKMHVFCSTGVLLGHSTLMVYSQRSAAKVNHRPKVRRTPLEMLCCMYIRH